MAKIKYNVSEFSSVAAEAGALCVMVKTPVPDSSDQDTGITTHSGSSTPEYEWLFNGHNESATNDEPASTDDSNTTSIENSTWVANSNFLGVGICQKVEPNKFRFIVSSVTYFFDSTGLPASLNARGKKLMIGVIADFDNLPGSSTSIPRLTSVGSTAMSRTMAKSGITRGDGATAVTDTPQKKFINTLKARDQFALQALRGLMEHIPNAATLSNNEISFYCDIAYQYAANMMAAAAEARDETELDPSVNPDELGNDTDRLLYDICTAISNISGGGSSEVSIKNATSQASLNVSLPGNSASNPIHVQVTGGGGSVTLNEPLQSINNGSMGTPGTDGVAIIWNATAQRWVYQVPGGGGGGGGTGTVTRVGLTVPTGFTSGNDVVSDGNLVLGFASGYSLPSDAQQAAWTALQGYFTDGVANSAARLTAVSKTAWGQTYWTSGGVPDNVTGDMSSVGNITFSASGKSIGGILTFDTTNGRLGVGTNSPGYTLTVNGYTRTNRLYLSDSAYFEYDSTAGAVKLHGNFYADGSVSALGYNNSGGGGGTALSEPLASINSAGLADHPSSSGQTVIWNGTNWVYGNAGGGGGGIISITAGTGLSGGTITSSGTIAISSIYQGYINHGETAYGWGNHANAGYASASNLTAAVTRIGTLEGYFTDGVANNAARLTTVSKTAWGNTYWTSNGVPQDVSGNLSGDIQYIEFQNGVRLGVDTDTNTLKVYRSNGTAANIYATGGVSALGLGESGGGGGTALNEPLASINIAGLNAPTAFEIGKTIVWTANGWAYDTAGGGSTAWSDITGTPTTLSGYGIGDANISTTVLNNKKTITLGQNSVDIYPWAMASSKPSYAFNEITGNVAFNQLPTLYWANIEVSSSSNNFTAPQFQSVTIYNGGNGSYIQLGTTGNYGRISNNSANHLLYNAINGHTFSVDNTAILDVTNTGYVYVTSYAQGLRIGDGLITWDSTNNALKIESFDGTTRGNAGLYATDFISALGLNGSGGGGGGGASSLGELTDVTITNLSPNQVLLYNNGWKNGSINLNDLGNVTINTSNLSAGQVLKYQTSGLGGYWTNAADSGITMSTVWTNLATNGSEQINISHLTNALSGYITSDTTFWGQTVNNGAVSGNMDNVGYIRMNGNIYMNWTNANDAPGLMFEGYYNDGTEERATFGLHAYNSGSWYTIGSGGPSAINLMLCANTSNTVAKRYVRILDALKIGDGMLTWDSTNNAFKVIKSDGTAANLYATGGVSALGFSAGTSSVDSMSFNYLSVNNTLNINKGNYSNYIYTNTSGRLVINASEGVDIYEGMTVHEKDLILNDVDLVLSNWHSKIYFSDDIYLFTDGNDLKIHVNNTDYKLLKQ